MDTCLVQSTACGKTSTVEQLDGTENAMRPHFVARGPVVTSGHGWGQPRPWARAFQVSNLVQVMLCFEKSQSMICANSLCILGYGQWWKEHVCLLNCQQCLHEDS